VARFVKGDVVVVPFPFSDLTATKRRPALVLAGLEGDDVVLCQITTQTSADSYSIPIGSADFIDGGLKHPSNVRPSRLITIDSNIVLYRAGQLSAERVNEVVAKAVEILSR